MVNNIWREGKVDNSRRDFLKLWATGLAVSGLWITGLAFDTKEATAATLWGNQEVSTRFIAALESYESDDNRASWNMRKYNDVAVPLLRQWLDKPGNMEKLKTLIDRELKIAYRNSNPEFLPYNKDMRNDDVFFWNTGTSGNHIQFIEKTGTHYDDRLQWQINIENPDRILKHIEERIPEDTSGDVAFIMKDQNGIDIFVYYESGKLKYVLPTTPGRPGEKTLTPAVMMVSENRMLANYYFDGEFKKDGSLWKDGKKWGTMPYSRRMNRKSGSDWIYDGQNTHIGKVAKGEGSSSCARQGALGAYLLFYGMKTWTIVYYRPELRLDKES